MPAIPSYLLRGFPALLLSLVVATLHGQHQKTDTLVLHFAFDRSEIRPGDTEGLHSFVRDRLPICDVDSLIIAGYTDTVGTLVYNDRLSLRRAMAAAAQLRQYLGSAAPLPTLRIEGRGEADAVPGDDSASRRAILVFWHHPAPPPAIATGPDTVHAATEPDTVVELDDIRFYANTATLTPEAQLALPHYADELAVLRDHYFEVDGYCNSPGPPLPVTDPLYILSVQRAKFIYDYLVERGFEPGKLSYKGKGNTNPRNAHPTTRGESEQNMRVEIRVFRQKPD